VIYGIKFSDNKISIANEILKQYIFLSVELIFLYNCKKNFRYLHVLTIVKSDFIVVLIYR
jgi:hypothetical protein